MRCTNLSVFYRGHPALSDLSLDVFDHEVLCLLGPSGCGKSTLLRCLNRMIEIVPGATWQGRVELDGRDTRAMEVEVLRRQIGMVFQNPTPFPRTVFENVAYGLELHGLCPNQQERRAVVEKTLRAVGLWDEVADRLHESALALSLGQQQRLCIARTVALDPDVVLMDEPCSALDPITTAKVEGLIVALARRAPVILVTHNTHQARRLAGRIAYFEAGLLIETAPTEEFFLRPVDVRSRAFIQGRTG